MWIPTHTHALFPRLIPDTPDGAAGTSVDTPADLQAKTVHIVVAMNLRNEKALDAFLAARLDRSSSRYGKTLSTAERAQYEPTEAQVQQVVEYLRSRGFANATASANHLLVTADGPVSAAQAAFNTAFAPVTLVRGTQVGAHGDRARHGFANIAPAQMPSVVLGSLVKAVIGLDNMTRAETQNRVATSAVVAPVSVPVSGGELKGHYPFELASLYQTGSSSGIGSASGTTVGIIASGDLTQTLNDLAVFASSNGLNPIRTTVVQTGSTSSIDTSSTLEWNLDSQMVVAAAGGSVAQLVFYDAASMSLADITTAYNNAMTANVAKVVNVSLGVCEAEAETTGAQAADDAIFKLAVAQGQTFVVASGDQGVYPCTNGQIPAVTSQYSVNEPASSPWVIAVGGTALYTVPGQSGAYAGETVWNDGVDGSQGLTASGGGVSAYEAAPAWQTTALGATVLHRVLPDIAFDAEPASGAIVIDSAAGNTQVGGTSLGAPIFAGLWARMESVNGNQLGFPAPNLYAHVSATPELVHSVTVGNNGLLTGTAQGYSAGSGFDEATGWGSLDASALHAFIDGPCVTAAAR